MKTPDEIKKGLEHCTIDEADCTGCTYRDECMEEYDVAPIQRDALAYIRRLEQINADFAERTAQLESQVGKDTNVPRWISAEEGLPEVSDVVLVIANGQPRPGVTLHNAFLIASYWAEDGWIADGYEDWQSINVSHWMPLPEAPKEG